MSYAELTTELDSLLHALEHQHDLPLDELTQKVQRAYFLIGEGRQQLRAAETAIHQVVDSFEAENAAEEGDEGGEADE